MKINVFVSESWACDLGVSESAIPLSMYRKWKGHGAFDRERYADLFKKYEGDRNAYRIYLPLTGKPQVAKKVNVPQAIVDALAAKGYVADDYRAGIAVDIKEGKRKIKIGKLLNDKPELQKEFNQDPQRQASRIAKTDMMVVISRHPYDIAGMSTGRGWRSCTSLEDGVNRKYVIQDVKHGTLIAYLVKADDKNIENPIARVRIYRFAKVIVKSRAKKGAKPSAPVKSGPVLSAKDDFILMREPRVYGTPSPQFAHAIDAWLEEVNYGRADGLYCVNKNVYTDNVQGQMNIISDPSDLLKKIENNSITRLTDTNIRLSVENKKKVFDAIMTKVKTSNSYSMYETVINNLDHLLNIVLTPDRAKEVFTTLFTSKTFLRYCEDDYCVLDVYAFAAAWHYGVPVATLTKAARNNSFDLDVNHTIPNYMPEDIHSPEELLANFYFTCGIGRGAIAFENSSGLLYSVFANPIKLTPEAIAKIKPALLRETVDDWTQDYDSYDLEYESAIALLIRAKNLYAATGKDLKSDKNSVRLLTDTLNDQALFEADLVSKDQMYSKLLERLSDGDDSYDTSLKDAKDNPELTALILKQLTENEAINDWLENKTVVAHLNQDLLDQWMTNSRKKNDIVDIVDLAKLSKQKHLDVSKYLTYDNAELWLLSILKRYTDNGIFGQLMRLIKAPKDSFLTQVYNKLLAMNKK